MDSSVCSLVFTELGDKSMLFINLNLVKTEFNFKANNLTLT